MARYSRICQMNASWRPIPATLLVRHTHTRYAVHKNSARVTGRSLVLWCKLTVVVRNYFKRLQAEANYFV